MERRRFGNVEYIERRSVARETLLSLKRTFAQQPKDIKRAVAERGLVSGDGVQKELQELVRRGLASYSGGSLYQITDTGLAVLDTATGNSSGMAAVLSALSELEGISRRYAGSMTSGAASLAAVAIQLAEKVALAEANLRKRDNELLTRERDLRRREARIKAAEKKAERTEGGTSK